jgi:hypothetical protein
MLVALMTIGVSAAAFAAGKGGTTTPVVSGPMSAVTVKVTNNVTAQPVAGARVRLYNSATGYSVSALTGSDGTAAFADVPFYFNYAVDLRRAGFVTSTRLVTVDEPVELFTLAMIDKSAR